jgi:transposase InsO family protein
LCAWLGYSKQAYYKSLQYGDRQAMDEQLIVGLVLDKRRIWKRGSGRNLWKSLEADFTRHHLKIGRDKFFDLLRRQGLLKPHRKRKITTTDSYHRYHKYPNLIKDKMPLKANEIWVSDITYIYLSQSDVFCYLFLITDLYSRKIVGYSVCPTLEAKAGLESCIHHSDRGVQYCCDAYTQLLKGNDIAISMTENGDPLENAVAERINKTIKEEFTDEKEISFKNLQEAKTSLGKFIDFYNNERRHRSIDWLTPNLAHQRQGELKRHWKIYYKKEEGELRRHEATELLV